MRLDVPWSELSDAERRLIVDGDGDDYDGIRGFFQWLEKKKYKVHVRVFLSRYRGYLTCPDCGGTRLRREARDVRVGDLTIDRVSAQTVREAARFFADLHLSEKDMAIADKVLNEIRRRLGFLSDVGLDYLTLDRLSATLSGGEAQRINLATSLGSALVGTLYVLDEPSIGLHPRDNERLIAHPARAARPGQHGARRRARRRHDRGGRPPDRHGPRRRRARRPRGLSPAPSRAAAGAAIADGEVPGAASCRFPCPRRGAAARRSASS